MDDKLPNLGTLLGYTAVVGLVAALGFCLWCALIKLLFAISAWIAPSVPKVNLPKKAHLALGLGLLLVLLNGLFPPFTWGGDWQPHQEGYRFLFASPAGAKIIFSRFFVQFVTIVAATAGAYFLFWIRDRNLKTGGNADASLKNPVETAPSSEPTLAAPRKIENN